MKKRSDIEYLEIRKSKDLRTNVWKVYDGYLEHLANNHPMRLNPDFLTAKASKKYEITLEDVLFQDEELYYLLSAKGPSKGMHNAQLLIREKDFAIFRITIFWKPENANNFSWAWEKKDSAEFFCSWQQSTYEYDEFNGKMYPKRSSWHRKGRVIKTDTKETVFRTESIDELLITKVDEGTFEKTQKVPLTNQNIYQMADYFPYQSSFWKSFNKPVDSELFKKAKSKMEDHQPLEEQFLLYSGTKATNIESNGVN